MSSAMMAGMVSASERMAPVQGLQPSERSRDLTICGCSPGARHKGLLDGQQRIAAHIHGPLFGEVEIDDGNLFFVDVLPDVHLRPVGERKDANAFAGMNAGVVEVPQLGALVLRVPLAGAVAEGVDALLGAGFLFIAARAAKCRVEVVVAQRVEQRLRLRAVRSSAWCRAQWGWFPRRWPARCARPAAPRRPSAPSRSRKVSISANLKPVSTCSSGNGIGAGIEGLLRQAQHHGRVFADGVEHHRPLELGGDFAQNVDALGFKQAQMAQARRRRWSVDPCGD